MLTTESIPLPAGATPRVVVIGAGMGGLSASILLAARGAQVTVLERAADVGGKMRRISVDGLAIDSGPTVFTMRWVFEELFAAAGASLAHHVPLRRAELLARHAWSERERLDLFADPARSEDAIGRFAGAAEARGFRTFRERAARIYRTLEHSFLRAPEPTPLSLTRAAGPRIMHIRPFDSLWKALGQHFRDPRLRQLFGRYATYCGSSPFLAPATLMLIAHVEQDGVWLVDGGMHRLARAMGELAEACGATIRTAAEVAEITVRHGRAAGVRLADGEELPADAIVANADSQALAAGLFGAGARAAVPAVPPVGRSLSAVTQSMVARVSGFPLSRHNVFFSADYAAEFDDILRLGRLPRDPTVYVCAQDRDDACAPPPGAERLFTIVNAPARDGLGANATETAECEKRMSAQLLRCGLTMTSQARVTTTPAEFAALFPASGGALYGMATHGAMASFRRPTARSRLPGLYLAGGSVHPGAGAPMAALSGRMAANALLADLSRSAAASTSRSRRTATPGGTSTP